MNLRVCFESDSKFDKEKLEEEKAARAAAGTGTGNDLFSRISSSYQRFNQLEISHFPS